LYTPFECGCILTRDLGALETAFSGDGEYMQDIPTDEINMFRRGPELSRGDRALKLWLLMRSVGTDAICAAIREDMRLARLARDLLAADARVEIVTEPILSIFTFALAGGEEQGRRLVLDVLEDGLLMLSSSRVGGRHVVRFCVLNHRTTEADVQGSVRRILELIA
jgi:aromatic-L-amino-acid decarboxylase